MLSFDFETYREAYNFWKESNDKNDGFVYSIPYNKCRTVIRYEKKDREIEILKRAERPKPTTRFICDLPEYISPITRRPVDGRAARREELKRNGCREVDPSEFKVEYQNKRFIEKHGIRQ